MIQALWCFFGSLEWQDLSGSDINMQNFIEKRPLNVPMKLVRVLGG
ncbi:hypothetical protein O9992_25560 [Vibrio lentus]|nr:hypothetical protein [Vibrio lentus]